MIILGSPASGKTALARRLSADLEVPCLCKDDIKEALFDVLGVGDREASRRLSDASFAAQLRLARWQLDAGLSCIIEGNWRAAHAAAVSALVAASGARPAQVWCRAESDEIARRFAARSRHPGHLDAALTAAEIRQFGAQPPTFLHLAGARAPLNLDGARAPEPRLGGPQWIYDSDRPGSYAELLRELKIWRS